MNGENIIDLKSVKNINDILNKETTDYFIRQIILALENLSEVYHDTIDANIFKEMKDSVK